MKERTIPTPPIDVESEAFYQAAKQGRFLIRRCLACGRAHWHPRSLCPHCFGPTEWSEALGDGEIYSYSVMRRAEPPYAIAYVKLAEGPTMLTNIVATPFDAIAIGSPVKLVFTPTEDGGPPVPCFRVVA